jgi:hypothetical protein
VAEASRRHEGDARPAPLDHEVGRERGGVDDALYRAGIGAEAREHPAHAGQHALFGRVAARELLRDLEPAGAVGEHDVGEGAADVDAEEGPPRAAPHRSARARAVASGSISAPDSSRTTP